MAYEKLNLADGDVLKAEHLTHMETELARQKSWNELGDKPTVTVFGDTLKWKALTEDTFDESKLVVGSIYPISDAIITLDECAQGGRLVLDATGGEIEFSADDCVEEAPGLITIIDTFFCVKEDNATLGEGEDAVTIPKAGLYIPLEFAYDDLSFTLNGYGKFKESETFHATYMPYAKFYFEDIDEGLLYNDAACTVKTTKSDIEACNGTQIRITVASNGTEQKGYFSPLIVDMSHEYAELHLYFGNGFFTVRTAEYTPETT